MGLDDAVSAERIIFTPRALAAELGCSLGTLARWRRTGEGPRFARLNATHVVYRLAAVESWLLERERAFEAQEGGARGL